MARRLPLIAALLLALPSACQQTDGASGKQAEPRSDPYADGRRLVTASAGFGARWQRVGNLPDCASLLGPDEAPLCEKAKSTLSEMQRQSSGGATEEQIIRLAANTALAAERATAELRRRGLGKFATDQKSDPKSGVATTGSASPKEIAVPKKGAAPAKSAKSTSGTRPVSGTEHEHVTREHENPHLEAIQAYASVAVLGLRQLAVYLENGPLATRRKAAAELERLSGEEPSWSRLRALAREGALIESDTELKKRLTVLGDMQKKK